jgi:hypothetical protein
MTDFDKFALAMFAMLFVCSVVHQFVWALANKEKYPTRDLFVRVVELCGRLTIIPAVFGLFLTFFSRVYSRSFIALIISSVVIFMTFVGMREVSGVNKRLQQSMQDIAAKVDDFNSSQIEILIFNFYTYTRFSTSMAHHFRVTKEARDLKLRSQEQGDEGTDETPGCPPPAIEVLSTHDWRRRQPGYEQGDSVDFQPALELRSQRNPILTSSI